MMRVSLLRLLAKGGLPVGLVIVGLLQASTANAVMPGRLVYEIVVTAAGTKSQGWQGVLYDAAGAPIEAAAGQTVTTALGDFIHIACEHPWDACGMVRTDMAEWMKTHQANIIMDAKPWIYRMYVRAEGSKSEVWTSRLLHDGQEVFPLTDAIDTPMGPFRTGSPMAIGWGRAGWFPASWHEPTP